MLLERRQLYITEAKLSDFKFTKLTSVSDLGSASMSSFEQQGRETIANGNSAKCQMTIMVFLVDKRELAWDGSGADLTE